MNSANLNCSMRISTNNAHDNDHIVNVDEHLANLNGKTQISMKASQDRSVREGTLHHLRLKCTLN